MIARICEWKGSKLEKINKKKHITQVLAVLGSAVLSAILLVAAMLYYYNPSGQYLAENTLLSPQVAQQLHFSDLNPETAKDAFYVFSGLEFAYYDPSTQHVKRVNVNNSAYQSFYNMISTEKNVEPVTDEILSLFQPQNTSVLSLLVTLDIKNTSSSIHKVFQKVEFAPKGNYYRIQLIGEKKGVEWIYFYHPRIEDEVMRLFL